MGIRAIYLLLLVGVALAAPKFNRRIVNEEDRVKIPPRFERGSQQQPVWSSPANHILQSQNQAYRYVDYTIKFGKEFDTIPKVALTTYVLDWEAGSNTGYIQTLQTVTTKDFTFRVFAPTTKGLYTVFTNWFATDDQAFHVQYFNIDNLDKLIPLTDDRSNSVFRTTSKVIEISNWTPREDFRAVSFINGVVSIGKHHVMFQGISEMDQIRKRVTLTINTWNPVLMSRAFFSIVFVSSSDYWVSPQLGYRVPDFNHPWVKRSPSVSDITIEANIPEKFRDSKCVGLTGITGWDMWDDTNIRLNTNCDIQKNKCKLITWWDSRVVQFNTNMLIYKPFELDIQYNDYCFLDGVRIKCPRRD